MTISYSTSESQKLILTTTELVVANHKAKMLTAWANCRNKHIHGCCTVRCWTQPKKGSADSSCLAPCLPLLYVIFFFCLQTTWNLWALTLPKILKSIWKCYDHAFQVEFREHPSECITGILTTHCFLICLCAFMGFYVKCKLRLGSQIHGKDKMQINIPKWTITLFLSPYTCYRCQRMSVTVSASLDFGFFSP